MAVPQDPESAFRNQVAYCLASNAPVTAQANKSIWAAMDDTTEFGRRILSWPEQAMADALPLRATGGFHALWLSGKAPELAPIYGGSLADEATCDAAVRNALHKHQADLLPWLDGPPQTNEAGRSSNYIAAMHWLAARGVAPKFEINEIGSSAGLNLLLSHYHYDLAGLTSGPADAVLEFAPEWKGNPPPDTPFTIVSTQGCDVAPVDLRDPAQALRLKAYIWPEHFVRFERMEKAIALVHQSPPDLVRADAADWVEMRLATPQSEGTTRTLVHSIVWQYLPAATQDRITKAMEAKGAEATREKPLAWIAVEANRETYRHELVVRHWPGDGEPVKLAGAHPHGAWIDWES